MKMKTTLKKKIADIFCTLMKAAPISNSNPVVQSSVRHVQDDRLIGSGAALRAKLQCAGILDCHHNYQIIVEECIE